MTADELRAALRTLGLTYHTAAEALRMGKWGYQSVGKWARGEIPVPGPVAVALELMIEQQKWVTISRMK